MRNFWLILSVLWLWTCSGGGDKATGPEEPPIVINLTSLGGQAQKGPFNNGTAINVAELTNTLSPTGRNFSSAITDNTGRFAVANVQLESPYVELRANGFYFNEVTNEISDAQLTLFAISNLTGKTSLNVNILTHLEKNRIVNLMSGDNPKTFAQAKLQAQEEVLAIFDYSRANVPESELLDISQGGAANAKLLAISAIIQGDLSTGQMSELLANISTDISSDGTLDNTNLIDTLISNTQGLDMSQVRSNLEARYSSLGISATIPDFESEILQFLKPPVANDMSASTDEDTAINITLDATDPEGEFLTYTILEVNNATITLSENGDVATYTPNAHFNGSDTFTYYANDGTSDSNIATVTVTVNAIDDEPNTTDVSTTTDEDIAVVVSLSAEEYDGDSYSFAIISQPSNGSVSLDGTNATYTPSQDFNGEDTFTFEATDDRTSRTNIATATITVNPINDDPVSNDISVNSNEDEVVTYDLSNDASDVDGDELTYSVHSQPGDGNISIEGSILTYTPNANYYGSDTSNWTVSDGIVSLTKAFTVNVTSVNDVPVATDMTVSTNETRFISLDITLDVTDADGDALTYSIVNNAANGTTTLNGDVVTYVPTTDWNGEDSFTFKANDGTVDSNTATATITVNAVDDAPVVVDSTFVIDEDQVIDITLTASDVDDEDLFTWAGQSGPSNGTVVILDANSSATASKTYRYTPNTNYNGNDSFTYYATNQNAQISNTATISFTINPVNDGPIANNLAMTVIEDFTGTTVTIKGDNNGATDPEGDAIKYYIVDAPTNGSIYNDAGGGIPDGDALESGDELTSYYTIYNPNADFNGEDTFTFKGSDGSLDGNTATVTVTVEPRNDPPFVPNDNIAASSDEDTTVQITLSATDIDSSVLTYTFNGSFSNGTGTIDNDSEPLNEGVLTYTPNPDWYGTESVGMYVEDENSRNSFTLTITVNPVNDHPVVQDTTGIEVLENRAKEISLIGTDIDDDSTLSYSVVDSPSLGTVTFQQNTATYTPSSLGSDSFTFKATDSDGADSNIGTVSLTIVEDTAKTFSTGRWAWANDIIETTDGGFLLAGNDKEMNSGDRGDDQYLVKTNSSGDEEWSRTLGEGQIYSVIETDDGNFAFAGGNPDEAFISKVDASGNQIWLTEYSNQSYNYDTFSSIKQTTDGGYIVVGASTQGSDTQKKGYVVKLDSEGNEEWTKYYGFSEREYFRDIKLTSDGGYIIGGQTRSIGNGESDYYLVKIDASGNEEWYKTYGGSDRETMQGLVVLPDGGFLMSGVSQSFTSGWSNQEPWLVRTDSSGNLEWSDSFIRADEDNIRYSDCQSITITQDGNIVITGQVGYYSKADSNGNIAADIHITKIDLNGNQLWTKSYGGDRSDIMYSIVSTSDGGFALGGYTSSFGEVRQGGSAPNMWLIKTSSDGTQEF